MCSVGEIYEVHKLKSFCDTVWVEINSIVVESELVCANIVEKLHFSLTSKKQLLVLLRESFEADFFKLMSVIKLVIFNTV